MLDNLRANFDSQLGGFGSAPKFPHPADLELCLREGEKDIALVSLERMGEGGIYDQLGGGFCRYSVDAQWMIPHFEKMLYDNGPLLALLADAWLMTSAPLYARCAEETAGWLMREMQSPEGGYYSSLDADSEHEEGKFYVWSRDEVQALLPPVEYAAFAPRFGLDRPANFEGRHWHLHVAQPVRPGSEALIEAARAKLFAAREQRVRPGRDEKVLVSWNALAIRGMAHAGRVFGRPQWVASARRALVCAPRPPAFDRESGSKRVFDTISFLRDAGWAVTFVAESADGGDAYRSMLQQMGVAVYAGLKPVYAACEAHALGRGPDPTPLVEAFRSGLDPD